MMRRSSARYSYSRPQEPIPVLVQIGAFLALVAFILFFAGPIAYRTGLLSLTTAIDRVFVGGGNLGGVAAALCLLGMLGLWSRRRETRRGFGRAVLGILVGATVFAYAGRLPLARTSADWLSDVTTDTEQPPEFVAMGKIRGASSPSLNYPGAALAARQREAFPDIQPIVLPASKDEAFAKALAAVRRLGWTLVSADGPSGRIEASASTQLFGTTQDVVVRVRPEPNGSRVDIRSVSREIDGGGTATLSRVRAITEALGS
jgi:hypothetical protein